MDGLEALSAWEGRQVELRIEDQAGHDPLAPPRAAILQRVTLSGDGNELQFYLDARQYLAVPLSGDARVELEGHRFQSVVPSARLIYKVTLV